MYSHFALLSHPQPVEQQTVSLPLAEGTVQAGFPSPAEGAFRKRLDLSELLVAHPQATFLLRVAGPSMRDEGIDDGDLIVVDRAIRPCHGHIVVAVVDGEFTVKRLHLQGNRLRLKAGNPAYPDLVPCEPQTWEVWGVVTACIKRFVRSSGGAATPDGR